MVSELGGDTAQNSKIVFLNQGRGELHNPILRKKDGLRLVEFIAGGWAGGWCLIKRIMPLCDSILASWKLELDRFSVFAENPR